MMFDGGWPYLTRERAIVLILALIGLGWLLAQTSRPDHVRLSLWGGSLAGDDSGGLVGVAEQTGQGFGNAELRPQGNPLRNDNTVMTQGYGVGSHAPAHIWGAIDLALDSDNDGQADPEGSWGQPIYATHPGTVKISRDSWPAGNHIWIVNNEFRTGYAHLRDFAVQDGAVVTRGQVIGYMGSTGQSSGPHLDYQVWQQQSGRWVNLNPLDLGTLVGGN